MNTSLNPDASLIKDLNAAPIRTGAEYVESLRGRKLAVYFMGDLVGEPVDHRVIRPSINAVAETYDFAIRNPTLATAVSSRPGSPSRRSCL